MINVLRIELDDLLAVIIYLSSNFMKVSNKQLNYSYMDYTSN